MYMKKCTKRNKGQVTKSLATKAKDKVWENFLTTVASEKTA